MTALTLSIMSLAWAFGPPASGLPDASEKAYLAAIRGDVTGLQAMIAERPDLLNQGNRLGRTPLHGSVLAKDTAALDWLLSHGAKIDAVDQRGDTALHAASAALKTSAVAMLLEHGAALDAKNKDGQTPLFVAVRAGTSQEKARAARKAIVEQFAKTGADISVGDSFGVTPLHMAAMKGRVELLEYLVRDAKDVNRPDQFGRTSLHLAAAGGSAEMIDRLMTLGAKVDAVDKKGRTPLHQAAVRFRSEAAARLLAAGAKVDARDQDSATPLILLARQGTDSAEVDKLACDVARVLLDAGADASATDAQGRSALDGARTAKHEKLAEMLSTMEHSG